MGDHSSGGPRGSGQAGPGPGDALAARLPGTGLAGWLEANAGTGNQYPLLGDADMVAAAGRWDALESWCAARKLSALREIIRRSPATGDKSEATDAPLGPWRFTLDSEIGLELAATRNAADGLLGLAVTLQTRLPLTAAALEQGILNLSKVRMIADLTSVLSDEDARKAEELIAGKWHRKTWGQLRRLVSLAVVSVDPDGARKRREKAEREDARVRFWIENAGTAGISATGVPADDALRAMAAVQDRALAYKKAGLTEPMHLLRVRAFIDLITGQDARTASAAPAAGQDGDRQAGGGVDDDLADYFASDLPDSDDGLIPDSQLHLTDPDPGEHDHDLDSADDGTQDGDDDSGRTGGVRPGPSQGPDGGNGGAELAANVELTLPLATLMGLAEVPGEAHDLGALDPAMARRLAATAAAHPDSTFTLVITDSRGRASAFGVSHPRRGKQARRNESTRPPPQPGLPARISPAAKQPAGPDSRWDLDIAGRSMTVTIVPVPGGECDHRRYTPSYQPGVTLRRLIQVRDGECTMPICLRHPRGTDFEHTVPHPAGPTCSCNGSCRCRRDHRIKQSKGWQVRQDGGRHTWITPTGRTYIKEPREYPS